ncbi:glycosyltransferase family 2 protein [Photobacterium sanguinicancri]|uniref:glycosyltransferase family 2 protein n=1 Tax=Photobacterium sanguinicancri TaxID=875932 RepID=UPI000788BAB2|nr:glycosyltransferase family 2 protein [Photobacterium sanguinicancri]KXI22134.1 hypothetical protein AS132_15535 [Photobacterium sanguinicancri]
MNNDLVSIIMPCYNVSKFVRDSIESVFMQTYKNWELILINDCSTDNTLDIIREVAAKDNRVVVLSNLENKGGAISRNLAVDIAKGRYIAFLDSDDIWRKDKLKIQISFMKRNNFGFTFSDYTPFSESKSSTTLNSIIGPRSVSYRRLLHNNVIGCLTVVYDVTFYGKFLFPISKKRHDFALWLQMLKKFDVANNVGIDLAYYRIHSNSLSSNKADAFQSYFNVLHKLEGLSYPRAFSYTVLCSFLTLLKKKTPKFYKYFFDRGN